MKLKNRIGLTILSMSAVVAPIAVTVACGGSTGKDTKPSIGTVGGAIIAAQGLSSKATDDEIRAKLNASPDFINAVTNSEVFAAAKLDGYLGDAKDMVGEVNFKNPHAFKDINFDAFHQPENTILGKMFIANGTVNNSDQQTLMKAFTEFKILWEKALSTTPLPGEWPMWRWDGIDLAKPLAQIKDFLAQDYSKDSNMQKMYGNSGSARFSYDALSGTYDGAITNLLLEKEKWIKDSLLNDVNSPYKSLVPTYQQANDGDGYAPYIQSAEPLNLDGSPITYATMGAGVYNPHELWEQDKQAHPEKYTKEFIASEQARWIHFYRPEAFFGSLEAMKPHNISFVKRNGKWQVRYQLLSFANHLNSFDKNGQRINLVDQTKTPQDLYFGTTTKKTEETTRGFDNGYERGRYDSSSVMQDPQDIGAQYQNDFLTIQTLVDPESAFYRPDLVQVDIHKGGQTEAANEAEKWRYEKSFWYEDLDNIADLHIKALWEAFKSQANI